MCRNHYTYRALVLMKYDVKKYFTYFRFVFNINNFYIVLFDTFNLFNEDILLFDTLLSADCLSSNSINSSTVYTISLDFTWFNFLYNLNGFVDFFNYINNSVVFSNQHSIVAQFENLNLENMRGIYHYSIPTTKLYYPEPFIASPSFLHYDPWFIHVLIYQYWLWFVFIFVIIFFFITFMSVMRWTNPRLKPRRETRGVSRSKCGDLITATVPVIWAASIIIHESTDAVDLYDGFGTTELAVGIRAFQWGWEYYYPKDIDINYNLNKNNSFYMGNSLKFNNSSAISAETSSYWRFYQQKASDRITNPAQLLLLNYQKLSAFNYFNFNSLGCSMLDETNSFSKANSYSTLFQHDLTNLTFSSYSANPLHFKTNWTNINTQTVTNERQTSLLANSALFSFSANLSDLASINKLAASWLGVYSSTSSSSNSINAPLLGSYDLVNNLQTNQYTNQLKAKLYYFSSTQFNWSLGQFLNKPLFYSYLRTNYSKDVLNNLNLNLNNILSSRAVDVTLYDRNSELLANSNQAVRSLSLSKGLNDDEVLKRDAFINNFKTLSTNTQSLPTSLAANTMSVQLGRLANSNKFADNLLYTNSISDFIDVQPLISKTSNSFFLTGTQPILTNNPYFGASQYDSTATPIKQETPFLLQGDDEFIPQSFVTTFWNYNTASNTKTTRAILGLSLASNFYNSQWPTSSLYADYDFRRWQANELLEESFWESLIPNYSYYDYLVAKGQFAGYTFLTKSTVFDLKSFLSVDKSSIKSSTLRYNIIEKPYLKDISVKNHSHPLSLTTDDDIVDYSGLGRKNFFLFHKGDELSRTLDGSYDSTKAVSSYGMLPLTNTLLAPHSGIRSQSVLEAFDTFRATNEGLFNLNLSNNLDHFSTLLYKDADLNSLIFLNKYVTTLNFSSTNSQPNLVYTLKNIKGTYGAIQKIFKPKFDEMRSHTRLREYSQSTERTPFISVASADYRALAGKSGSGFIKSYLVKSVLAWPKNNLFSTTTANNTVIFDFPFLLSVRSDASRYIWTDWNSKWNMRETQASSLAKYGMYGMNQIQKVFDFGTNEASNYKDAEQYTSRLSHTRQNTINSWMFTPYNYLKINSFFNVLDSFDINNAQPLKATITLFHLSKLYWTSLSIAQFNNYLFFSAQSGSSVTTRNAVNTYNSIGAYQFYLTKLGDILTKREFLYRQVLELNSNWTNVSPNWLASPTNPLFQELKSAFRYLDITTLKAEYGRNNYLADFNFSFQYTAVSLLSDLFKCINLGLITDKLLVYLTTNETLLENYYFSNNILNEDNSVLLKSQSQPIKKGIANMIKLHATGAIALPIEMRLQLLASSRDVIHSWAIPSAGIKIDCVPGYSSHRVITFLLSGIYWGQCMEICGRYHHWMPIIVYFMKRDLFLLWCIHFIFIKDDYNNIGSIGNTYSDSTTSVSHNHLTWLAN